VTVGHPLRYLGHELFTRYDLLAKFKVLNVNYFDVFKSVLFLILISSPYGKLRNSEKLLHYIYIYNRPITADGTYCFGLLGLISAELPISIKFQVNTIDLSTRL